MNKNLFLTASMLVNFIYHKHLIIEEFKEWSNDPIPEAESIWTLPDLTSNERLKNFCRSIKKEIR